MKTLIVDDDSLSCQNIRDSLGLHREIVVLAECRDAREVMKIAEKNGIDLMFLDVQMPGINGFQLLERLKNIPYVIFCTDYDPYALEALETNQIDYLLKPVVQTRLDMAIERMKKNFIVKHTHTVKIEKLLKYLRENEKYRRIRLMRNNRQV